MVKVHKGQKVDREERLRRRREARIRYEAKVSDKRARARARYEAETEKSFWRFLQSYIDREGFPPTRREIAAATGYSRQAVMVWLSKLEAKGILEVRWGYPRAIKLRKRMTDGDV
jgi:SOS-response transcriptional repressor LexA